MASDPARRGRAEANARFYRAFEALDLDEMDEAWAHGEHVQVRAPGLAAAHGWDAVRESWARIFENTEEMRFTLSDVQVVVGGDAAWVTCTENILSEQGGASRSPTSWPPTSSSAPRPAGGWSTTTPPTSSAPPPRARSILVRLL